MLRHKLLVFEFPCWIAARFVSEWLSIVDICMLDKSCCEAALRRSFLSFISYEGTILTKKNFTANQNSANALSWLNLRGVSIEELDYDKNRYITQFSNITSIVCRHLKVLCLMHMTIDDSNKILENCPALQALTLTDIAKQKKRKSCKPESIPHQSLAIKKLYIRGSSSAQVEALKTLGESTLQELELSSCKVRKDFAKVLANKLASGSLELLSLKYCDITDSRFARLLNCGSNIRKLSLDSCSELGGLTIDNIASVCKSLEYLDLTMVSRPFEQAIKDDNIVLITENCTSLQELRLANLAYLTDAALRAILRDCHKLITLIVDNCSGFVGEGLLVPTAHTTSKLEAAVFKRCSSLQRVFNICEVCPALRELRFEDCHEIRYGMFTHTFAHGCQLQVFAVSSWHLYGHDLDSIVQGNLPHLRTLDLSQCQELTDDGMMNITRICPNLLYLSLWGCSSLSNTAAHSIGENGMRLQRLDLRQCTMITEYGLLSITAGCKELQWLALSANRSISCGTLCALGSQALCLTNIQLEKFPVGGAFFAALMELLDQCSTIDIVRFTNSNSTSLASATSEDTDVFLSMLRRIYPRIQISEGFE